jgi:hypothetical protein
MLECAYRATKGAVMSKLQEADYNHPVVQLNHWIDMALAAGKIKKITIGDAE